MDFDFSITECFVQWVRANSGWTPLIWISRTYFLFHFNYALQIGISLPRHVRLYILGYVRGEGE